MSAQTSAIVAALIVLAASTLSLSGCGQRSALYLPVVPPLPAKPVERTAPPADSVVPAASEANPAPAPEAGTIPDTSGTPLSLSPDSELNTVPDAADASGAAAPTSPPAPSMQPHPASDAPPVQ